MDQQVKNRAMAQRTGKISVLFVLLSIAVVLFLLSVLNTISTERRIPSQYAVIHDRSFRGNIISADNYTLSASRKTYKAVVRAESIDPGKREVFIKLFSIYSGISEKALRKRFYDRHGRKKKGNVLLSKTLTSKQAMQLKSLAYKLRQLKVFRSVKIRSGLEILYGLDITEIGESRYFPRQDVLSPILGYVGKKDDGHYTRPKGMKGLERKYDKHITSKKDGYFKGKRDVGGNIIHNKNSIAKLRVDGMDLHLNIPLAFQRRVEKMIDAMKQRIDADEILVGVMESATGRVLAMASTERYDPSCITQKDIPALNPKFAEYPYEPGSVLKPLTLSLALDRHRVTPTTVFNTHNGRMKIGKRRTVTDDDKFAALSATDIIVHSSNVGISQISWLLSGKEFRDGLLGFGLAHPSGIDLSRDLPGQVKKLRLLNNQMHRANSAYGYGLMATFSQLFKAYSAFNNDGVAVTPRLVDYLEDTKGRHYELPPTVGNLHPIGKQAAREMHEILKEVVKRGTGVKAQYPGLEIGGKTGTAHIAKHGHYVREYHSSFYGFANDSKGHKYTIGVLVIRAKKYHKYFASQSAVPTFKNTVRIMVEQGFLTPDPVAAEDEKEKASKDAPLYTDTSEETSVSEPILPPPPKEKAPLKPAAEKVQQVIPVPKRKPKYVPHIKPKRPKPVYRHPRPSVPPNEPSDLF